MKRVKLTQAGFTECVDTEDMAFKYFERMEDYHLLPTRKMLESE
jgi:hypothetical protein